ncbi:cell division protein DivIB [Lentibacillus populi]|uniref:Cell division protein DivIB n=1 Tax=Lentibacillus populi TaxID=1827502 RepID=A0A9W5TYD1_9BACI|nr:cell division protein FtsQ/DivIB [Lentibacillus populi]GGB45171.1 cell division protein DivIB [Lentibacillus populi]
MEKKKIVSIEDRIPKLKQARKKKANRRLIFYLSIFFLLISIIVYLQSPLSNVKTVAVTGNSFISDEAIVEKSNITNKTNIWTINETDIKKRLHKNPTIKSVEITKKLPRTVEIHLSEYDRVGYINVDGAFHPILGNGQVLTSIKEKSINGDAPLLMDFSDKANLRKMTSELNKLPDSILNMISEIHWKPTDEDKNKIMLYMNDGYLVDGTIRDFATKMKVYPSIVAQLNPDKKGIIHIGVGAYFESFDKETKEEGTNDETED